MDFLYPLFPTGGGSKFVSKFWTYLNKRLNVRLRLSTAYHPQTDGQTKWTNQVMETYLRIYCSYNQDDWSTLLPQAAFAYNNSVHSAIKATPFFVNHGFHPRWVNEVKSTSTTVTEVPSASNVIACLEDVFAECSQHIASANEFYSKYAVRLFRRTCPGPLRTLSMTSSPYLCYRLFAIDSNLT